MNILPKKIQIDIITGICNIDCIMCNVNDLKVKKIMSNSVFNSIINSLSDYSKYFEQITLVGVGEPLLDKDIVNKVKLLKAALFKSVGVYTNGILLDEQISEQLILSKLDSLIISIDSIDSDIYSKIRKGAVLKDVLVNVKKFVEIRNKLQSSTKIIIRFTKQELNENEFDSFLEYWQSILNFDNGDIVLSYDVHNFAGNILIKHLKGFNKAIKCPEIFDKLYIHVDGEVGLCCGDINKKENIGSIINNDLKELYNNEIFIKYRTAMEEGNILDLDLCKNCTIGHSILSRELHEK